MEGSKNADQKGGGARSRTVPPNVILITLDAFNYDLFIENIDTLPNLKRLRAESVCFDNAFSVGPSTFFSFPGIIASVYPYSFGVGIHRDVHPIDRVLKENGYNTAQINECNALLTPFFGYGRHTDYQQHFLNLSHADVDRKLAGTFLAEHPDREASKALRCSHLAKRLYARVENTWVGSLAKRGSHVAKFLKLYLRSNTEGYRERGKLHAAFRAEIADFIGTRFNSPQFLFMHTIVNHLPYFPPEEGSSFTIREVDYLNYRGLSGLVNPSIGKRLKSLHVESMRTTDALLGDVVEALRARDALDSSILILTADHGEEFMEEGYFGHVDESSSESLLHVPFILRFPALLKPNNVTAPVSTIDILPAVCNLAGCPIPPTCRGLSLTSVAIAAPGAAEQERVLWERPLFSEAWRTGGLLDRNPGDDSVKKIFTARKGHYRLKVTRDMRRRGAARERVELEDWTAKQKLDLVAHQDVVRHLRLLLDQHLEGQAAFAAATRAAGEQQRLRAAARRIGRKQ